MLRPIINGQLRSRNSSLLFTARGNTNSERDYHVLDRSESGRGNVSSRGFRPAAKRYCGAPCARSDWCYRRGGGTRWYAVIPFWPSVAPPRAASRSRPDSAANTDVGESGRCVRSSVHRHSHTCVGVEIPRRGRGDHPLRTSRRTRGRPLGLEPIMPNPEPADSIPCRSDVAEGETARLLPARARLTPPLEASKNGNTEAPSSRELRRCR